MIPLQFIRVGDFGHSGLAAECVSQLSGEKAYFNNALFDDIPEGSYFVLDWPSPRIIEESEIPGIIEEHNKEVAAREVERQRRREEMKASGKYIFENWNGWETTRQILSEDYSQFWQAAVDKLNEVNRMFHDNNDWTIERAKAYDAMSAFMVEAQEGDRLEWYYSYRDPISMAAGFALYRNGELIRNLIEMQA